MRTGIAGIIVFTVLLILQLFGANPAAWDQVTLLLLLLALVFGSYAVPAKYAVRYYANVHRIRQNRLHLQTLLGHVPWETGGEVRGAGSELERRGQ